ncbi:MAG: translation elongation factor-like protein [Candidatus Altiarchaeota archaeon]
MEKKRVGVVFTYFSKVGVAGIKLEEELRVGDKISIEGHTTNIEQVVESMQIERNPVQVAKAGQEIGIKVNERVRPNDVVYKILE